MPRLSPNSSLHRGIPSLQADGSLPPDITALAPVPITPTSRSTRTAPSGVDLIPSRDRQRHSQGPREDEQLR